MAILGPFSVAYPVDFRNSGDTTTEAFGKHIQEIERIYGIINSLDADKISASDFTTKFNQHVNSSSPHPNLTLSGINGNLDMSRIPTGNLTASRVSGALTNASIDYSKVDGLADYVRNTASGMIPDAKGKGITTINRTSFSHGYAIFSDALILQWGRDLRVSPHEEKAYSVSFPMTFPNYCINVLATTLAENTSDIGNLDAYAQVLNDSFTTTGFKYYMGFGRESPAGSYSGHLGVSYIAIGY